MDNRTEPLADGVWRIEVGFLTNAYLLAVDGKGDADGLMLIDTGWNSSGPGLVRSIRLLGFDPTAVRQVVLTHWHLDHTGSAARFADSSARPSVVAGRNELPAIRGDDRRPQLGRPPGDVTPLGRLAGRFSRPGPPVRDVRPLDDGDHLAAADGAVVVATPGHTAGHISLHLPNRGIVLAGDAVMTVLGLTRGLPPSGSARSQEAASLRRLAALDFDVLAAGHGPPVVTNARRRLERLADRAGG